MSELKGDWQDGQVSGTTEAYLTVSESGWVRVWKGKTVLAEQDVKEIKVSQRLGNIPRRLEFSEKGVFVTKNNDAVDALLKTSRSLGWEHKVSWLESNLKIALVCLLLVIAVSWAGIFYVVPHAAETVSKKLPQSLLDTVGKHTLSHLDEYYFSESGLSAQRQQELQDYFKQYDPTAREIVFRKGGEVISANAFALPSSVVIFTDELVNLAEDDEELLSIYFHETGHIKERHGTRSVLQGSVLAVLLAFVAGDASGVAEILYTIPVFLTHTSYSREFETEADDYAYNSMLENKIALHKFADIMSRLEAAHTENKTGSDDNEFFDYFSTHPSTVMRIKRFREHQLIDNE